MHLTNDGTVKFKFLLKKTFYPCKNKVIYKSCFTEITDHLSEETKKYFEIEINLNLQVMESGFQAKRPLH